MDRRPIFDRILPRREEKTILERPDLPINAAKVREAADVLKKYIDGKAFFDEKVIENEKWWRLQHWSVVKQSVKDSKGKNLGNDDRPQPRSAWLFNSLANKHADAMDNYPEPNVLPRSADDKMDAEQLSKIIPVVLEQCNFEKTYSDQWWVKLKSGLPAFGVFWDSSKENGLGDISIKGIDILRLYWQPGITNFQDSENVFYLYLVNNDALKKIPLPYGGKIKTSTPDVKRYVQEENVDDSDKSLVVDWYYKKNGNLHLCKFCGEAILFASENEPQTYPRGYYEHGMYPFVLDPLFPEAGSLYAFSFLDIMKDPQMYIDKLNQLYLENVAVTSRQRYFGRKNSGVNVDEFCDLSNQIVWVEASDIDSVLKPIQTKPIDGNTVNLIQMKIDELKETSANRDFSQGSTSSGVTAAAAIAALQEAGNKVSRDIQSGSYRAYTEICNLVIENIRQFYDESRSFRITGEKPDELEFVQYSNANIKPHIDMNGNTRRPVFDIRIKPQRKNPYTKAINNETIKELFSMGFFNPQIADQAMIALDAMDFEGKTDVQRKVSENKMMYDTIMQLQADLQKAAIIIESLTGRSMGAGQTAPQAEAEPTKIREAKKNPDGETDYTKRIKENSTPKMEQATEGTQIL